MEKTINFGQFLIGFAVILLALSIFISTLILAGKMEDGINVAIQIAQQIG